MAVNLDRGNFDQRVTIKMVVKVQDSSTGHAESYPTEVKTWAAVDHKGGSRGFNDGNMSVFDRKDFYLTWRSTFTALDLDTVIVHNGIEYKYQVKSFVDNVKHILKIETIGS